MVPNLSIIFMVLSLLVGVIFPLILSLYLIIKKKFKLTCFLLGAACFFLFASILEGLCHNYFLNLNKTTSDLLLNNTLYYVLYGSLMAGIFEEVGRFIMMSLFMKKNHEYKDGFIFGLGHGFMEALLILGIVFLNNIILTLSINSGSFDQILSTIPDSSKNAYISAKDALINTSSSIFLLGGVERIFAITIHVAFSLVVLYAIRNKKIQYLFIAILGHALVDVPSALYQKQVIPLNLVYILLVSTVIILIFVIIKLHRSYQKSFVKNYS
ncbi:MAG: YhfC family intramembrane metalloprotease [Oscillospiraceae bacterium]|nr:YhfC family intramembrane metalloprotease [Oscillospiraceae bacterium]